MTEINTFVREAVYAVICRDEELEHWDSVVATLYTLGIEDAIDAWQSALVRFNARGGAIH
jgi:uncharacterized protein